VLSVGGYSGGPAALACVRARVPLAILEPNSVLGLANRLLAPFAKRAYVAWATTAKVFRGEKARVYGVPLRPGFDPQPYAAPVGRRRLLVLGGSQGSVALNERLPFAIARAARSVGDIDVVHQTGADREAVVREAYKAAGIDNAMVVSFVTDVADQMTAADIIVARGGAVTVAEISAIGRASIIVPFPHAADDHQAKNAMALADLGGSICVLQDAADEVRLGTELTLLFADAERRTRMARSALEHGHPYAAQDIARDLLTIANIKPRPKAPPPPKPANGSSTNGHSSMHIPTSKVVS
jgi:UDP-N-acetylglucosamine--N-acetylmuramyl-(pentapeptide) pyrophosphoryl-undecaprenol N-acetylglucosamine transferase